MVTHGKQAQDGLDQWVVQLRRDVGAVRVVLWEYWLASHNEHCTEDWPHVRDDHCSYRPPDEVYHWWHAAVTPPVALGVVAPVRPV